MLASKPDHSAPSRRSRCHRMVCATVETKRSAPMPTFEASTRRPTHETSLRGNSFRGLCRRLMTSLLTAKQEKMTAGTKARNLAR